MCRIAPSRVMGRMLVAMGRGGCGQARDTGRRARGGRNIMHPGVSPIAVWQRVVRSGVLTTSMSRSSDTFLGGCTRRNAPFHAVG